MNFEIEEGEVPKSRYRVINPLNQLVRIILESGGSEPVLRLQLEVWEKQTGFTISDEELVEARHLARAAGLSRSLAENDSLDNTLPVGFFLPRPSAEVAELRATIESGMLTTDEGTRPGSVSPIN